MDTQKQLFVNMATVFRIICITGGALLLCGCGSRTIPLQGQDAWFACENRRECIILEDPTCTLIPINRLYVRSFEDWVRRNHASELASAPCNPPRLQYEAVCEAQRCSSSVVIPDTADASRVEPSKSTSKTPTDLAVVLSPP